jgi:hypothetical protein
MLFGGFSSDVPLHNVNWQDEEEKEQEAVCN